MKKRDSAKFRRYRKQLGKWLEQENLILLPGGDDEYHPEVGTVTYNKNNRLEKQVYSILHECGHHLIQGSGEYIAKHKVQLDALTDGRKTKSLRWRISCLGEEFQAWEQGKELAKTLGIKLNEKSYEDYVAKCLKSYCSWVINPVEYEEEEEE
jgi:hypothetical protein